MAEDAREQNAGESASAGAQRWAARQKEIRNAIELDKKRMLQARVEKEYRARLDYHGSLAFVVGALFVFVLLGACWFVMDRMRCDPFYANMNRFSSPGCE